MRLPTVIATSVIRSTHQGQSHGGIYIVDLDKRSARMVYDWEDPSIEWSGRGGDRGLRGIAFWNETICIAASDEIFFFDRSFRRTNSVRNRYLRHCHEILVDGSSLLVSSTGFDSILELGLSSMRWLQGWSLRGPITLKRRVVSRLRSLASPLLGVGNTAPEIPPVQLSRFDPNAAGGPESGDHLHLNHVWKAGGDLFVSGTLIDAVYRITGEELERFAMIPLGSHNARPFAQGILMNDTKSNRAALFSRDGRLLEEYPVPLYGDAELENSDLPSDHARQGFARGLAVGEDLLIVGSSPATISVFRLGTAEPIASHTLTMDVRHAIHGLEIWPFDRRR